MTDMSRVDQLRRETGAFVKNHVDRFAVVMQGQPRYVGNKNWVDETVGFYRDTKEQFPDIPLDMFFVINDCDGYNKEWIDTNWYDIHQTGFPSVEYIDHGQNTNMDDRFQNVTRELYHIDHDNRRCYGKIPAKKVVFEDYMRQVFSFADSINFLWYDLYTDFHKIDCAYNTANPGMNMFISQGHGWKMQNFVLKAVYEKYKNYFDNVLTENSVVYKTRYDLCYVNFMHTRKHVTNLGNGAAVLHQFVYNANRENDIIQNPSYHPHLLDSSRPLLMSPRIVVQQVQRLEIIKGNIFSTDFAYTMDRQGFIDYATKYWDWIVKRTEDLQYLGELNDDVDKTFFLYKTKPECQLNKFFLENDFTIYTLCADHLWWGLPDGQGYYVDYPRIEVDLLRRFYPNDWDLHRLHFYDWDPEVVKEFFVIDETGIDVELYIP